MLLLFFAALLPVVVLRPFRLWFAVDFFIMVVLDGNRKNVPEMEGRLN